jgi:YbbR domain-containing protein
VATLPESVRLRLLAPASSWTDISPTKFKASADLSQLGPGLADVPIKVDVADPNIEILSQQPGVASVVLEQVATITLPVKINLLDAPPLGYINRTPTASPAVVKITGPVSVVEKVTEITTEAFMRNSKETVESLLPVVPKDADSQFVRDVTVNPAEVLVTVPVQQRFGYKDVSVRVQVEGQVAPGYRVSNISVEPPAITVVGNPQGLNQIAGLVDTVPINLSQATNSIVRTVPLNLPDGVTVVSDSDESGGPGGVQVSVEITPIEDAVTLQRSIVQQGIDPAYWWRASPEQVDVFLSGPLSQLRSLKASDVEVLVDLFDLPPGNHILQPTVFMPDGLRLDAILPNSIEVTIGQTVQKVVDEQGLSDDYFWTAAPNRVNVLVAGPVQRLQRLRPTEISVTLNLAGLEPGFHRLRPTVTAPDQIVIDSISPETLNVVIEPKTGIAITGTATITGVIVPNSVIATVTPNSKEN